MESIGQLRVLSEWQTRLATGIILASSKLDECRANHHYPGIFTSPHSHPMVLSMVLSMVFSMAFGHLARCVPYPEMRLASCFVQHMKEYVAVQSIQSTRGAKEKSR